MKKFVLLCLLITTYTYCGTVQVKHEGVVFTVTFSENEDLKSYEILVDRAEVEGEYIFLSGIFHSTQGGLVVKRATTGKKSGKLSGAIVAVENDSVMKFCFLYSLNKEVMLHQYYGMNGKIKIFDKKEFSEKIKDSKSINYIMFLDL